MVATKVMRNMHRTGYFGLREERTKAMDQRWADCDFGTGDGLENRAQTPAGGDGKQFLRLLVIGPDHIDADMASLARWGGVRLLGRVDVVDAADRLEQTALADAVWLVATTDMPWSALEALAKRMAARDCHLICEAATGQIDALYGLFSGLGQVVFLSDPDPVDRLVALAAAAPGRSHFVRDVAGDAMQERLDQLQDEVARISRLISQLSLQGGDFRPLMFPAHADDPSDYPPSAVRAPGRSFSAEPGARAFERTLSPQRQRARQIRQMIRRRRLREQFFPADLFADPAWDMLLDLYAAQLEQQPVSVSSLCIAAAVPATTALRWIKTMTDAEIFERQADPHDGRRVFIALGPKAEAALARYFEALEDQRG